MPLSGEIGDFFGNNYTLKKKRLSALDPEVKKTCFEHAADMNACGTVKY